MVIIMVFMIIAVVSAGDDGSYVGDDGSYVGYDGNPPPVSLLLNANAGFQINARLRRPELNHLVKNQS